MRRRRPKWLSSRSRGYSYKLSRFRMGTRTLVRGRSRPGSYRVFVKSRLGTMASSLIKTEWDSGWVGS
jgi:hypothetical protein